MTIYLNYLCNFDCDVLVELVERDRQINHKYFDDLEYTEHPFVPNNGKEESKANDFYIVLHAD